jgi:hypothetical protein
LSRFNALTRLNGNLEDTGRHGRAHSFGALGYLVFQSADIGQVRKAGNLLLAVQPPALPLFAERLALASLE